MVVNAAASAASFRNEGASPDAGPRSPSWAPALTVTAPNAGATAGAAAADDGDEEAAALVLLLSVGGTAPARLFTVSPVPGVVNYII